MSMTPAPSPGPTSTHGASVGNRPRCGREDLYEQCSDHITEYIASSRCVGSRPSSSTTAASSSSVIPSCRCSGSAIELRLATSVARECADPFSLNERPVMPTKPKKRAMSSDHKAALSEGRNQARAVANYLEALEANKPKRGRPRTVDSVKKRLATVEQEVKQATALSRLSLLQ